MGPSSYGAVRHGTHAGKVACTGLACQSGNRFGDGESIAAKCTTSLTVQSRPLMQDLCLDRTINVANSWVTAVKYMPALKCLAVTTFSRNLTMFDITSPFCTICGSIPKMEYTPMTMDIWSQRGASQTEMVIIGDSGGLVHLHRILPNTKQNVLQVQSHLINSLKV